MFVLDRPVDKAVKSRPHLKIVSSRRDFVPSQWRTVPPLMRWSVLSERQWTLLDEMALLGVLPITNLPLPFKLSTVGRPAFTLLGLFDLPLVKSSGVLRKISGAFAFAIRNQFI